MENQNLNSISNQLKISLIKTSNKSKIPHLGSCLSCLDILVTLYWHVLKINTKDTSDLNRDRFVLSKGHAAPILFQILALKGLIKKESIENFGEDGSDFHEHPPKPGIIAGIEAATGSLGHGLSMALGMAKAGKIQGKEFSVYVLIGDGECNEGSIWEAALVASAQKLNNLNVVIDYNKWQATGRSNEITSLEPLEDKWQAFGWEVQLI